VQRHDDRRADIRLLADAAIRAAARHLATFAPFLYCLLPHTLASAAFNAWIPYPSLVSCCFHNAYRTEQHAPSPPNTTTAYAAPPSKRTANNRASVLLWMRSAFVRLPCHQLRGFSVRCGTA